MDQYSAVSFTPEPPPPGGSSDIRSIVDRKADQYGVPRDFAHAIVRVESGYDPTAVSPKGAIGVMQVMPATGRAIDPRADLRDPTQNIDVGMRYLQTLYKKYGGDTRLVSAAYNAGEPAVDRAGGVPNYPETQDYTRKVEQQIGAQPQKSSYSVVKFEPEQLQPSPTFFGETVINPMKQIAAGTALTAADYSHILANTTAALAQYFHQTYGLGPGVATQVASDWLRRQQKIQEKQGAELSGGRMDVPSQIIRGLTQGVGEIPLYALASATPAGPIGGVAAISGIRELDKGWKPALQAAAEGALTGAALEVMTPASRWVRMTGAAAMTYARDILSGVPKEQALSNAASMAGLTALGPSGGVTYSEMFPRTADVIGTAGTAAKGAVTGAVKGAFEPVPVRRFGIPIKVPKVLVTAPAGAAAAWSVGLPKEVGAVVGGTAPFVTGAFRGVRGALAERAAARARPAPAGAPETTAAPETPAAPRPGPPVTGPTDDALINLYSLETDPVKKAALRTEMVNRGLMNRAPAAATPAPEANPYRTYTASALQQVYKVETDPAKRSLMEQAAQDRGLNLTPMSREARRATVTPPETGAPEERGPSLTQDEALVLSNLGISDPLSAKPDDIAIARQMIAEDPGLVGRLQSQPAQETPTAAATPETPQPPATAAPAGGAPVQPPMPTLDELALGSDLHKPYAKLKPDEKAQIDSLHAAIARTYDPNWNPDVGPTTQGVGPPTLEYNAPGVEPQAPPPPGKSLAEMLQEEMAAKRAAEAQQTQQTPAATAAAPAAPAQAPVPLTTAQPQAEPAAEPSAGPESPLAGNAQAAKIAADLEEAGRVEALTDFVIAKKVPYRLVKQADDKWWNMVAEQAGRQPPTPEQIAQVTANIKQQEDLAKTPSAGERPAEVADRIAQQTARRKQAEASTAAAATQPPAAPAAETPAGPSPEAQAAAQNVREAMGLKPEDYTTPAEQGAAAATAPEERIETLAKTIAGYASIPTEDFPNLANEPALLEQLSQQLGLRRPAPGEVQQIIDRATQLRQGETPAAAPQSTIEPSARPTAATEAPVVQANAVPGTSQEVPQPRVPVSNVVPGSETVIRIPGETHTYNARYSVRELEDVQPSHNPHNFQPNPQYHYRNDRDYSNPSNQERIIVNSQRFDPAYMLMESPDAVNGAPVIDPSGNVLGGNSRAMILNRVYQNNPAGAAAYRKMLEQRAALYGIDPAELANMKRPVLVREMTDEVVPQRAITELNKVGTAQLTPTERATADARMLSSNAAEYLAGAIEAEGPDATLNDALSGKRGAQIVNKLVEDGVFGMQEKPQLVDSKTGAVTAAAKERISKMLLGQVFESADQMNRTPLEVRAKLERSVAPILQSAGRAGFDLRPAVRQAIDLMEYARAHGMSDFGDAIAQESMFGPGPQFSAEAVQLAEFIRDNKPTAIAKALKRYVANMEPTMFGESTPAEAFRDAFGEPGPESLGSMMEPEAEPRPPKKQANRQR